MLGLPRLLALLLLKLLAWRRLHRWCTTYNMAFGVNYRCCLLAP